MSKYWAKVCCVTFQIAIKTCNLRNALITCYLWMVAGLNLEPLLLCECTMDRKKILVVDDDAVILKALAFKLTSQGYDVLTATEGAEAVSVVRRTKPDLILLDVSFPPDSGHSVAWDGFKIMQWLGRVEEAAKIPIIVITGGDPEMMKDRSLTSGAVAFFHKPIDHDELVTVIRKILGQDAAPEPPAKA